MLNVLGKGLAGNTIQLRYRLSKTLIEHVLKDINMKQFFLHFILNFEKFRAILI